MTKSLERLVPPITLIHVQIGEGNGIHAQATPDPGPDRKDWKLEHGPDDEWRQTDLAFLSSGLSAPRFLRVPADGE